MKTFSDSYICSRVPAEAITIATLTYVSAMKCSAVLTSPMCEKDVQEQFCIARLNAGYKHNHSAG